MKQIGHVSINGETLAVTQLNGATFKAVKANPDSGIMRKNGKEKTYQVSSITEAIYLKKDGEEWNAPWIEDGSFNKNKYNMKDVVEQAKIFMNDYPSEKELGMMIGNKLFK